MGSPEGSHGGPIHFLNLVWRPRIIETLKDFSEAIGDSKIKIRVSQQATDPYDTHASVPGPGSVPQTYTASLRAREPNGRRVRCIVGRSSNKSEVQDAGLEALQVLKGLRLETEG